MNAIPVPYSTADAMAWVCELAPAAWAAGGAEFALDLGDGLAIGSLGVRGEDRGDGVVGVVGYWVTPLARGRGLASQALCLAAPWAAAHLGLDRQELVHDLANVASCRTAIAAGFQADSVVTGGARYRDGTPRHRAPHLDCRPSAVAVVAESLTLLALVTASLTFATGCRGIQAAPSWRHDKGRRPMDHGPMLYYGPK